MRQLTGGLVAGDEARAFGEYLLLILRDQHVHAFARHRRQRGALQKAPTARLLLGELLVGLRARES